MNVKTVVVVGSGIMGGGIAHVSALGGFATRVVDVQQEFLDRCRDKIKKGLDKEVDKKTLSREQAEEAFKRLSFHTNPQEAAAGADFAIEAATEDVVVKTKIFADLDRFAPKHAILATNTSALSITEIAAATERPRQVIGMHFFNPVPMMKLIEIIRGLESSPDTLAVTIDVGKKLGKEVVEVRESPGFVTSRINAMIGNEAFYMLQEGVASARDIDKALKLGLNHPMGPFEMVDLVGLDTRLNILRYLHSKLGDKFRPCPLLEQYVRAGRLGKKVGRGVYDYNE